MQRRPCEPADQKDLSILARDEQKESEAIKRRESGPKPGEFKTVPVTTTTVEGIGTVAAVHYGIITYEVTPNGVSMEKRAVWGQDLSGVMTFNE